MWVERKITKILGEEDDIVSGTIISLLDENIEKEEKLNAKQLHVAISSVLQERTLMFMSEFWDILDEAQRSSRGIVQFDGFSLTASSRTRSEERKPSAGN